MALVRIIRRHRQRLGLSLNQLADRTKGLLDRPQVSRQMLGYFESDKHPLGPDALGYVARALGTSIAHQPAIATTISGNAVLVDWGWQGYSAWLDLCELQADRGDGKGFIPLAFDTTPGYTDTAPFPATPVKWTYRAIYRVGDAQVGIWSAPVSITVPA